MSGILSGIGSCPVFFPSPSHSPEPEENPMSIDNAADNAALPQLTLKQEARMYQLLDRISNLTEHLGQAESISPADCTEHLGNLSRDFIVFRELQVPESLTKAVGNLIAEMAAVSEAHRIAISTFLATIETRAP